MEGIILIYLLKGVVQSSGKSKLSVRVNVQSIENVQYAQAQTQSQTI